ncbi:hypothetical protein R8O65_001133 [Klebsiella michiganensis]|nr:hypothetical protein [Klebsiella michiganensis]
MTTEITELAQSMSIERIKQIALGGTPTMGEKERLAITALYFSEQLKIATDAFQAAGLAQLAAEEALEKAPHRIAELEREVIRLQSLKTVNAALQEAQSEFYRGYSCGHKDALLESRTVKLPEPFKLAKSLSGLTYYLADEVDAALSAQGIKVEAE